MPHCLNHEARRLVPLLIPADRDGGKAGHRMGGLPDGHGGTGPDAGEGEEPPPMGVRSRTTLSRGGWGQRNLPARTFRRGGGAA